jgi:hypothetical protein
MGQQYKNKTISNNDNDDNDYNDDNDDNDGGSEVSDVSVRGRYAARRDAPERSRLGALPCWTRHDTTVFEVSCWLWALSVHVTQMLCILRFCKACKKQQRHVSSCFNLCFLTCFKFQQNHSREAMLQFRQGDLPGSLLPSRRWGMKQLPKRVCEAMCMYDHVCAKRLVRLMLKIWLDTGL